MIATNIEQSKRLVEAGLKPESADMAWRNVMLTYDFGTAMEVATAKPILYAFNAKSSDSTPAWSLSALWDIMKTSGVVYDYGTYESSDKVMESLVEAVCRLAKQGRVKYE